MRNEGSASIIQTAIERQDQVLAKQALAEIDKLLALTDDKNERKYLLFSRSSCFGILGEFVEAERQLSIALNEDSDDPGTRIVFEFNGGLLAQMRAAYPLALERLTRALSAYRRNPISEYRTLYEEIQQRRGFMLVTLERFRDAIPVLEESLTFELDEPSRSDLLSSLGLCYLESHDYISAREYFLKALATGVTERWKTQIHFYLGIAFFYCDMPTEAKREFLICERNQNDPSVPLHDIYSWLSRTSRLLGDIRNADNYERLTKHT